MIVGKCTIAPINAQLLCGQHVALSTGFLVQPHALNTPHQRLISHPRITYDTNIMCELKWFLSEAINEEDWAIREPHEQCLLGRWLYGESSPSASGSRLDSRKHF
jgi:hypothetical protein